MAFIYDLSDTWNAGATTFTAIKMNVTDTASAAGSKLIDLQVGGTTRFDVDKNGQVEISAGTALLPSLAALGDTNTGMWFPAADTVAWSTAGSERMRIDINGNVGIGTNAPAYRLDVQSSSDSFFRVKTTGTASAWFIGEAGAAGAVYYHNPSNTPSVITTNGSERVRITATGNVGVGTSSPDALLSVNGIASFGAGAAATPSIAGFGDLNTGMWFPAADTIAFSTGGSERFRITSAGIPQVTFQSADVFSNGLQIRKRGTTGDANAAITNGTEIGFHSFFGFNGTAYQRGAFVLVTAAENFSATNAGTNYAIYTAAIGGAATSERLRITANGNVGIGTTAPDALLSVNGIASLGAGAAALPSVAAFGDLDTGMWFPTANTLAWSTGGSERMRITSVGNLGLGTSTFGTSAATAFAIATGTAPTTGPADTIQIYSTDLSAGNTMLSLYTEGTVVNANTTAAATHRIAIRVNGTVYYLLANTAA